MHTPRSQKNAAVQVESAESLPDMHRARSQTNAAVRFESAESLRHVSWHVSSSSTKDDRKELAGMTQQRSTCCSTAVWFYAVKRFMCCVPSPEMRPLHVLMMKSPDTANTIMLLELAVPRAEDDDPPAAAQAAASPAAISPAPAATADKDSEDRLARKKAKQQKTRQEVYTTENWRRQMDGVAYCYMSQRQFSQDGARQKALGDFFAFTIALCSAIVPVLIGLQGSLGDTPDQKQAIDSAIKYSTIGLSVLNTVFHVLERTYNFRTRGSDRLSYAAKLLQEIEDYASLSGHYNVSRQIYGGENEDADEREKEEAYHILRAPHAFHYNRARPPCGMRDALPTFLLQACSRSPCGRATHPALMCSCRLPPPDSQSFVNYSTCKSRRPTTGLATAASRAATSATTDLEGGEEEAVLHSKGRSRGTGRSVRIHHASSIPRRSRGRSTGSPTSFGSAASAPPRRSWQRPSGSSACPPQPPPPRSRDSRPSWTISSTPSSGGRDRPRARWTPSTRRAGCNLKHPTRSSHLAHKTLRESQHLEAVHANRSHHTQTQMALSRIGRIKRVLSCIATRFEPGPLTRPLQAHCHMR